MRGRESRGPVTPGAAPAPPRPPVSAPVIGISTKSLASVGPPPGVEPASSVVGHAYVEAVWRAGGVPWPVPLRPGDTTLARTVFERLDGLLLPGGTDIDVRRYGPDPRRPTQPPDPARDDAELAMARWAVDAGLPLFGICRGMQLLNVAMGGTLWHDVDETGPRRLRHDWFPLSAHPRDLLAHEVRSAPGSRLRTLLGGGPVRVNSLHHQAVRELGAGLVVTARAPDGVVEALEAPDHPFLLGVQWHPEELVADGAMLGLFRAFVAAATARGGEAADGAAVPVLAAG